MTVPARELREAAGGPLASRLSARYLEQHCLIPLRVDADGALLTAVAGPIDDTVADELTRIYQRPLRLVEVPATEVLAAIMSGQRQPVRETSAPANGARASTAEDIAVDDLAALANQAPVIQLVNVLVLDALRMGASDIHVEPHADGLRVRYRLDGVLQEVSRLSEQYRAAVISRLKIMSGLDIAERRRSQDGRARIRAGDRETDMRVSTLPALHGESIVLRILDHAGHGRGLSELGMGADVRERFERMIRRTSGIILVTGPTGSGKTTTLYAALARVNAPGVKIVTVEDPVEYQIPEVIQIPVNARAGFGFDGALRSILRHDPDVIMVGEMRDQTTAELAIQAALTGHLVFSTLHTNDAPSAITRLVDMGIEPYLVAATVHGIVAQRLVRMLCQDCAEPYTPEASELAGSSAAGSLPGLAEYRRPRGCASCSGTGYRGRAGIYELLPVSDVIRELIARHASLAEIRSQARSEGVESLAAAGWRVVQSGGTSVAELLRVTNEDEAA